MLCTVMGSKLKNKKNRRLRIHLSDPAHQPHQKVPEPVRELVAPLFRLYVGEHWKETFYHLVFIHLLNDFIDLEPLMKRFSHRDLATEKA